MTAVATAVRLPSTRELLPHRYPMLLVDRVLEVVAGQRLTAVKAVTLNEPWYAEGMDPAYPRTLLVESWGQSAGILANLDRPDPGDGLVMLAGAMTGVEFFREVYPGDVVRHEVRLFRALSDTMIFEGESRVGDELVMTLSRMVMAFRPAAQLKEA
jgi:3-hydroxyacyl-[acyl-carrier-protein] dehydratase